jgi:histo-blood group ABO system transferase
VKIAVLVMATGKYLVYVRELVESGRRYFLPHHEVTFYVFTDGKFIAPDVVVIPQVCFYLFFRALQA